MRIEVPSFEEIAARSSALNSIRTKYASANSYERWDAIREAYELEMPAIMAARARGGRSNPNFIDWKMTPIEYWAWTDIRYLGLPLYPQVPVAGAFVDFGDPYLRIGVELDGAAFHNRAEDLARDRRLWAHGWRIFRIPGTEAFPRAKDQMPACLEDGDPDAPLPGEGAEWIQDSGEGVLWALREMYFRTEPVSKRFQAAVWWSLAGHKLADFPLERKA